MAVLPTEIINRIMRFVSHPVADMFLECVKRYRNISMVKLRDGRILPLYRINQKKEEQHKWYTHYERKIIKNKIIRHYHHLDMTYVHSNREHIQAIRDAEGDITITNKCWYLLTFKYFI